MERYKPPECNETNCTEYHQLNKLPTQELLTIAEQNIERNGLVSPITHRILKKRGIEIPGNYILGFDHHSGILE